MGIAFSLGFSLGFRSAECVFQSHKMSSVGEASGLVQGLGSSVGEPGLV